MAKASASKKYREEARIAAEGARVDTAPWKVAEVKAVFYHKVKRRRDDVNHLQMLKPAYDGVVDSGLLPDDDSEHLKTLTPEFKIDRECPRVELTFTRKE